MARYIDADKLEEVVCELNFQRNEKWNITRGEFKTIDSVLFEFPTADVRENVHGEWIDDYDPVKFGHFRYKCSKCGARTVEWADNFCFQCGAYMRGEEDE